MTTLVDPMQNRTCSARRTALLFLVTTTALATSAHAVVHRPAALNEIYRVTTQSTFSGWTEIPAQDKDKPPTKTNFSGSSKIIFRERVLPVQSKNSIRLFRIYDASEYTRKTSAGQEKATLRPEVSRILLEPEQAGYLVYSPDTPLQFPEVAMIDEHVHLHLLETFLPTGELNIGRTWNASNAAISELTGVDVIESGSVLCKVEKEMTINGRTLLQISANGQITAKAGPAKARCNIRGGIYVDPKSGRFISLRTIGKQETLDQDNRVVASLDVDYQVLLEPLTQDPELADDVVQKLPSRANPELLVLVFDSPAQGIHFEHARHWSVQQADANRILLAGPEISFVMTTESDGKTPSTNDYLKQVEKYLAEQKIDARLIRPARESSSEAGRIGNFRFETTLKGRPSILDYWVVERKGRGCTIAVNASKSIPPERLAEVETIARTMRFQ